MPKMNGGEMAEIEADSYEDKVAFMVRLFRVLQRREMGSEFSRAPVIKTIFTASLVE